jgi:RND family efflux transporter MFP subunit
LFSAAALLGLGAQGQSPSVPVQVAAVVERSVASTVELVGTVMPKRRSIVASGADGLVIALGEADGDEIREVQEGDAVTQGQVLAQLRTRTLQIQEEAAKAALTESERELDELTAGSLPEEIERARAALAAAEAKAKMVQSKHQRLERLVARSAASGEDLDDALGLTAMAVQDIARLKAEYDLVKSGPRREKIAQAQARVEAADAELRRIQDVLDKRTVRAPFDGFIVAKHTEVGQWLSQNSPVFEVVELKEVDVQVMVPERHIQELHAGGKANVRIEALGEEVLQGVISRIVPQADTKSRLFPVMIRLKNPMHSGRPLLQAGMFAVARLPLGARHVARLVPKDALVLQAGKSVVFVLAKGENDNGNRVSSLPVKAGFAHNGLVEVEGNLKPGQQVVVRGNERLADGQAVQLEETGSETPEKPSR